MVDTPFFPPWTNRFNPMGSGPAKVIRAVRAYTLCQLESCFTPWMPTELFPKATAHQNSRDRDYTRWRTFWCLLWQAFNPLASGREVVRQLQALFDLEDGPQLSPEDGAYCRAKARLPLEQFPKALSAVAQHADQLVPALHWLAGRPLKVADGSTLTLQDTPKNRAAYPPIESGDTPTFPLLRLVVLFSLLSGAIVAVAQGAWNISELALLHGLAAQLTSGDILLGDRGFGNYPVIAWLKYVLGVDFIGRTTRRVDGRRRLQRLGRNDWLLSWKKSSSCSSPWLSALQRAALPAQMTLRAVKGRGYRREHSITPPGMFTGNLRACVKPTVITPEKPRSTGLSSALDSLGLRRNTALLLMALVLAGTGEKLWLGFAPKYLQILGASTLIIGSLDGLQTLLGALYAYPGGWLTDRWGQRRSLLLFSAISLAGYALVWLWQHWLALALGAFLFLAWSALSLPTTFSVVATSLAAQHHTMGIGVQSLVRRVPMMLGPLAGGWLITRFGWTQGVRYALGACIVLCLLTMLFQWLMIEPVKPAPTAVEENPVSLFGVARAFSPELRELLVSDILIRFCERIPYTFVILWAMNHGGINAQQYGWLVACEMVAAMLCYLPVAHLADKYGRHRFVLATFVFFSLFPVTLLFAHDFKWLAFAFVVRGLKEFGEPARKALIIGQATPELRARTYGAYYLIRDSVVTSGSFLGTALWSIGPTANFLGATAFGIGGTLWFWWFVLRRRAVEKV